MNRSNAVAGAGPHLPSQRPPVRGLGAAARRDQAQAPQELTYTGGPPTRCRQPVLRARPPCFKTTCGRAVPSRLRLPSVSLLLSRSEGLWEQYL
jgi:hypothetical protein